MNRKLVSALVVAVLLGAAVAAHAVVNAPVNIAYPIAGSTVKNYFTVSFSTTCPGGQHTVRWTLDGTAVGSSTFYDTFSAQFLHKLPAGQHTLKVGSSCGSDSVTFKVM